MSSKKGFTLIEALVVISIIGFLLSIAGIVGKEWLDNYRVDSQMQELYVDLMNSWANSMQKSRSHFITFGPAAGTVTRYTVYRDTDPPPDGNGALNPALDEVVKQKDLNPVYNLSCGNGAVDEIDFDSKGLISGFAGTQTTIRVNGTFGAANDCITVSPTRIRIGAWDGTQCVAQ